MVLDRGCGEARPASADVPGGREINVGEERSLECSQSQVSGKDTLEMILFRGIRPPC